MELPLTLLENTICRGTILHSDIFETIDHGKFFVIMGIDGDNIAGFFYVNSRIHESIKHKPEQYELQYPIKPSEYAFLDHVSYVCASSLITIQRSRLAASMMSGETKRVGVMRAEDMELLLGAVRESKLFSKAEKCSFFYE